MFCTVCGQVPCDGRCPWADGMAVRHCELCDSSIRVGELMVALGEAVFHVDCVQALAREDWVELLEGAAEVCVHHA